MSDDVLRAAIKEPVYTFTDLSPLTPELVTRCVELVRGITRWNRNTTSENHVVCVSDDRDIVRKYLSVAQRDHADKSGDWTVHGTTWGRWGDKPLDSQIIWINPNHNSAENYVNTFAHELAHAFTRTSHGWTWRRMFVMSYPLVRCVVLPDAPQLSATKLAQQVVLEYRRRTVNGRPTVATNPEWRARALEEVVSHVTAAERCRKKFCDLTA